LFVSVEFNYIGQFELSCVSTNAYVIIDSALFDLNGIVETCPMFDVNCD
jgi:hypothetical protein